MLTHPEQAADELRNRAQEILAEADDPSVVWQNDNIPKVWVRLSRVYHRAAIECELICKRYLEAPTLLTDQQFNMLAKAIGSRGEGAERAARMVLVQGMKQSDAASECGITQQSVWLAIERYRKALITMQVKP